MTTPYAVGQAVRLRVRIWEPANGDHPGGTLGEKGDRLIVRRLFPSTFQHPIAVAHEHVTSGMFFCVSTEEIEPWPETEEVTG